MSLVITPNKQQALSLKNQLLLLSLPANKRVRILKTLGIYERKLARERIKKQKDVNGKPFNPRKGSGKGKLLKRLGKTLKPFVFNKNRLELKHENPSVGKVAAFHSEGGAFTMNKTRVDRRFGKLNKNQPCSRGMAKALSKKGFKVRKNKGKGYRRATIKELMSTLTMTQAGAILKRLRNREDKSSWQTKAPPRSFLGDSTVNVQRQLAQIIEQIN
ncbi:hypothetical protein [Shewanella sp.]|uniref:hypothetical protein n=1 Tax=Shewanella sp. TaxID=50422 RepID=UPI001EBA4817|nr:hypothetical protein [Shewanella sp.]NRB24043.1 hypothetical protein [Shewanella sp.]